MDVVEDERIFEFWAALETGIRISLCILIFDSRRHNGILTQHPLPHGADHAKQKPAGPCC